MIPDQGRMLDNLSRTARTAGHDTILETWKLKRLLAGTALAEAAIALADSSDEAFTGRHEAYEGILDLYRAARESAVR